MLLIKVMFQTKNKPWWIHNLLDGDNNERKSLLYNGAAWSMVVTEIFAMRWKGVLKHRHHYALLAMVCGQVLIG